MNTPLPDDFFRQEISALARSLIGCVFFLNGVGGRIVETESYDASDAASHSFNGPTPRNASMFGPPGRAYVYRIYGAHWCFNIVGGEQPGGAVLLRALEPTVGLETMWGRRGSVAQQSLCAGPGRLCQALGITREHNGMPVIEAPFSLTSGGPAPAVATGPRIGIRKNPDASRRFGVAGSPFLSRRFPLIGAV